MKLLKSINNFTNRFNFWTQNSPKELIEYIRYGESTTAIQKKARQYTEFILQNRHLCALEVSPIANSIKSITNYVPIVMLSALVVVQTFSQGQSIVFDARVLGLMIAFILLLLRAPFIVVVVAAALVSALYRYLFN